MADDSTHGSRSPARHLDRADLEAASAAAAARAATVRRGAEARARRLRAEAVARIESRRTEESALESSAARAPASARTGRPASGARRRRVVLSLRSLVLGAIAMVAISALVGALTAWALLGMRGGTPGGIVAPPLASSDDVEAGSLQAAAEFAAASAVTLRVEASGRHEIGSGIVYSADGLVVTNAHVVTLDGTVSNATVTATTADGRVFEADVVGLDPLADLAVLRLGGATDLTPATWATDRDPRIGDIVMVLGSPLGLAGSVSSGIVSNEHRAIEVVSSAAPPTTDVDVDPSPAPGLTPPSAPPGASNVHLAVFQTDADINPGNSGGPVINLRGEVVGVAVAIARPLGGGAASGASGSIGIGFAIPASYALRVVEDLAAGRPPSHGALGVSLMSSNNVTTGGPAVVGAYIETVAEGGAADRAGLRRGDIVTAVNGVAVSRPGDLLAFVRSVPGGTEVELTFLRQGESRTIRVTVDTAA